MHNKRKIAAVILNYNSFEDTLQCVTNLQTQSAKHQIIIVDNQSQPQERTMLKEWFETLKNNKAFFKITDIKEDIVLFSQGEHSQLEIMLVLNDKNRGYASGNNVGLKIANRLGATSALIINPDIKILDSSYLESLENALFSDNSIAISASQITNQNGTKENPLQLHQSFFIDFFWFIRLPYIKLRSLIINNQSIKKHDAIEVTHDSVSFVKKVSGACFLIKMNFLQEIDFLDEGTFLYLEETILSLQAKKMKRNILFVGNLNAVHCHDYVEKQISAQNSIIGANSYLHYLEYHSHFNRLQKILLKISIFFQILAYKIILIFQKV